MGKFYKMMGSLTIVLLGLSGVSVVFAQEVDSSLKLEKSANQLKVAVPKSNAGKSSVTQEVIPNKRQNSSVKKQKKIIRSQPAAVQATSIDQQKIEAKIPPLNSERANQKVSVRAEAQAIARAAALAQTLFESQSVNNSVLIKVTPFNRTMRLPETYNLPPTDDGFHDPANEGISALHLPQEAFADLPRRKTGNRVDWVAALNSKKISPRWDRTDEQAEKLVMDMDIVRVVNGSMPDVVFPHKQHTEWLACSNCHPAIFVPQKGANLINMRLILKGEKCGVCHGKVAFPPSECSLCHSQKKSSLKVTTESLGSGLVTKVQYETK